MDLKMITEALKAMNIVPVANAELANQAQALLQDQTPATQTAALLVPQPPEPLTFWTCCDKCKMRYKHVRIYLNRNLHCPNCREFFLAVETAEPDFSMSFDEAKASGSLPWAPFKRTAAPAGGVVLALPKMEVGTQPRKRMRRASVSIPAAETQPTQMMRGGSVSVPAVETQPTQRMRRVSVSVPASETRLRQRMMRVSVSVRAALRDFDYIGLLREKGRVYVVNKQELLNVLENAGNVAAVAN